MNLIKIYEFTKSPENTIEFLRNFKLIPTEKSCENCNETMKICPYDKYPEKYVWRCRNKYQPRPKAAYVQCDTMRSIRDGTFFGKTENFGGGSNLSMFQVRRTKNCFCAAPKGRPGMSSLHDGRASLRSCSLRSWRP